MKELFGVNSKFIEFMNTLADVFVLNICFLIGCLPVITIGASLTAAFSVSLKIYEARDSKIVRQFWKAYKDNLVHGIILTLGFAFVAYCVWMDVQLFNALPEAPIVCLIVAIIVIAFTLLHGIYIFPLEARYDNSLWTALQNARKIGVRYYPRTLFIFLLLLLEVFLFYTINNNVLRLIGLLVGPMILIMTISGMVLPVFKELEREMREGEL